MRTPATKRRSAPWPWIRACWQVSMSSAQVTPSPATGESRGVRPGVQNGCGPSSAGAPLTCGGSPNQPVAEPHAWGHLGVHGGYVVPHQLQHQQQHHAHQPQHGIAHPADRHRSRPGQPGADTSAPPSPLLPESLSLDCSARFFPRHMHPCSPSRLDSALSDHAGLGVEAQITTAVGLRLTFTAT